LANTIIKIPPITMNVDMIMNIRRKDCEAIRPLSSGPTIPPIIREDDRNAMNSPRLSAGVFNEMKVEAPLKKLPNASPRKT